MVRLIKMFSVMMMILLLSSGVMAQTIGKDSLKDLKGVHVIVDNLKSDIEKDGLSTSTIQADVEQKLRMAGIKVLTEEEWIKEPGGPYLYVGVSSYKRDTGLYAFHIEVELSQDVILSRKQDVLCPAVTWACIGLTGTVGAKKVNGLRNKIKDRVDLFINDYFDVNPKEQ